MLILIIKLGIHIYIAISVALLTYQMMFLSFNGNTTGVTSGAGTAKPSGPPEFTRFLMGFKLLVLVFCVVVSSFSLG